MAVTPGRRAALLALRGSGRGRRLDLALDEAARSLDDRERRFAHELAFGTVRLRGRLDHLLALSLERALPDVDPDVLDVLRLGAYQLLHMDVPDYAAVSQAVELAPTRASGLVNAVLRSVGRRGENATDFPSEAGDPAGWLATWGSHPRWLVDRWLARWSVAEVSALVALDNTLPPVTIVPIVATPDEAVATLAAAGIDAVAVGGGTRAVALAHAGDVARALAALPAAVQDPGASLVVDYAGPPSSGWVADLCAAPGGKALGLAARGATVLAVDRSERRLARVRENAARTGLHVLPVAGLAERPPIVAAACVLLDVPCTGTGTLRRHPDARWRLGTGDPAALAAVQDAILDGAAAAVAPGGLLVYSTCSLEPEENQERASAFLERHADFEPEPQDVVSATHLDEQGRLLVLPWRMGFDGAFATRMRRRPPMSPR